MTQDPTVSRRPGLARLPARPRHRSRTRLMRHAILLTLAGAVTLPPAVAQERAGYRGEARNPFAATEIIRREGAREEGTGRRFERAQGRYDIPAMELRGIVSLGGGGMAALLEVEGHGTHLVREGDTIGLYEQGSDLVIRIGRIDRLHVEVEAGSLRQVIIVR